MCVCAVCCFCLLSYSLRSTRTSSPQQPPNNPTTTTNIKHEVGNPQALGAKPLTFVRQVVSLVAAPFLLDHPQVNDLFPADAVARARSLLKSFGVGGVGGYTDSRGNILIRNEVADFIERRDGHRPEPEVKE